MWTIVVDIGTFVVAVLLSVVVGLVENDILRHADCCQDGACYEQLWMQQDAYYNNVTGLRSSYVVAVVFLFLTVVVNWQQHHLAGPRVVLLLGLTAFVCVVISCDNAIRSFAVSPFLDPVCSTVSGGVLTLAHVLAWIVLTLSTGVFYALVIVLSSSITTFTNMAYLLDPKTASWEDLGRTDSEL